MAQEPEPGPRPSRLMQYLYRRALEQALHQRRHTAQTMLTVEDIALVVAQEPEAEAPHETE